MLKNSRYHDKYCCKTYIYRLKVKTQNSQNSQNYLALLTLDLKLILPMIRPEFVPQNNLDMMISQFQTQICQKYQGSQ
jgi:hypothetical protein